MSTVTMFVELPVKDIRFDGGRWTAEQLQKVLAGFGFTFAGPVRKDGLQNVTLPTGWKTDGGDRSAREWRVLDDQNRVRLRVITKVPWGEYDEVHFMYLEPASPESKDPRKGW